MGNSYGKPKDLDFLDWYNRVLDVNGIISHTNLSYTYDLIFDLKYYNLWDSLSEVYLFCGGDWNTATQKLKYSASNVPTLTSAGFTSSTYVSSGSAAGIVGNASARVFDTYVTYNALTTNDRSVGCYETRRTAAFFPTLIGRQSGGGNSAFGPTVIDSTNDSQYRFLDTDSNDATISTTDGGAGGLFITSIDSAYVRGRSHQNNNSTARVQGTIQGTGDYIIGGGIGGGVYMNSNLSFAFLGKSLTPDQMDNMDIAVNKYMTRLGCNVY